MIMTSKELSKLMSKVTRFEVIDSKGRSYTTGIYNDLDVKFMFQDEGKTLKVFLNK